MQTGNYLPYTVEKGFQRACRRRGGFSRYARYMQRYAHRRARQAIRQWLHRDRDREPSKHKFWVTGWDID